MRSTHYQTRISRPSGTRTYSQRGASSLELVLLLPFVVLVFLLLIGLGHTLGSKQHAVVAARYSTSYDVAKGDPGNLPELAAHAASRDLEQWQLSRDAEDATPIDFKAEGIDGIFEPVYGFFNEIANALGVGAGSVTYLAETQPDRGIVPRLYHDIPTAKGRYVLPKGTFTCSQAGGSSYLTMLFNEVGVGELLGTDGTDCCKTYTPD